MGRLACYGLLSLGALGAGVGVAGACLPDLTPNLCGNGHIDSNESCDPGVSTNPGCSSTCQIVCPNTPQDGGARYYFDSPSSNHCYFTWGKSQTFSDGNAKCGSEKGHLVTYVDDYEVEDVVTNLAAWPSGSRYWVGDHRADGGAFSALAPAEPGWAKSCFGCYMHGVVVGSSSDLREVDGGAEAGLPHQGVISTDLSAGDGVMEAIGDNATARVICEREPVGARSEPCAGNSSFCFNVPVTAAPDSERSKRYLYNPTAMTADAAEAYCRRLSDGGSSSLVIFESRAEREQVIYELGQVRLLPGGGSGIPAAFWIGLSGQLVSDAAVAADGGANPPLLEWFWDDGKRASTRPLVWGLREPGTLAPARAYIRTYTGFDTGLAHARAYTQAPPPEYPFVCQY